MLLDVHFPTTDGRELVFARYTEPEGSTTPTRPTRLGPARAGSTQNHCKIHSRGVGQTFSARPLIFLGFPSPTRPSGERPVSLSFATVSP